MKEDTPPIRPTAFSAAAGGPILTVPSLVQLVIRNGATYNYQLDAYKRRVLHLIAEVKQQGTSGDEEVKVETRELVEWLLKYENIDSCDWFGRTPLHVACMHGNTRLVALLLSLNANVRAKDRDLRLPLHTAVLCKDTRLMKILLRHCADIEHVNARDLDGRTPLMEVVHCGSTEVAQLLLEKGADPNICDINRRSPIHEAAAFGKNDLLKLLIDNKATVKIGCDLDGNTPLLNASKAGHYETVELLLKKGAPFDPLDKNGPLFVAAAADENKKGNFELVVNFLVRAIENINIQDERGRSALQLATGNEAVMLVDRLLDEDFMKTLPNVHLQDYEGNTSLHEAVRLKNFPCIFQLMDAGSNPTIQNVAGESCFDLASRSDSLRDELTAALYLTPPSDDIMKKGDWLRALHNKGRNMIKLLHDNGIANPVDSPGRIEYTYAPLKAISSEKRTELENKKDDWYYTPLNERFYRRGRVVILYQTANRPGAEIDVCRFDRLFTALGFDVEKWKDYSSEKIIKAVSEEKKKANPKRVPELFTFIIMSHGDAGNIVCSDDKTLNINTHIRDQFDGQHWSVMRHSPKLFIIQCCRGQRVVEPTRNLLADGPPSPEAWAGPKDSHPMDHFLVINSTCEDYKALRHEKHGAWFLEELVLLMELYAHEHHIYKIAEMANAMLSKRMSYTEGAIQTAKIESTLKKDLYILPKKTDD